MVRVVRRNLWLVVSLGLAFATLGAAPAGGEAPVVLVVPANEEGLARYQRWKPLAEYLAADLDLRVSLQVVEDHAAVLEGMEANRYDLAFVNPVWYVFLRDRRVGRALARPRIRGADTYRSVLIVHRDSIILGVGDLAGRTIALTTPFESAVGYFLPLALLEAGGQPVRSYERILFSDTFQSVLKGVAYGRLEAGFVSSRVLEEEANAALKEQVRAILSSKPVPGWTVVARQSFREDTAELLQQALLGAAESERGRAALRVAGFEGFVAARDEDYAVVREYLKQAEGRYAAPE